MTVHVCAPETVWARAVHYCPTCDRRRRMVGMLQVWYSTVWTCCACGDAWSTEGRRERPFARGWRDRQSAKARTHWAEATSRQAANATIRRLIEQEYAEQEYAS